MPNNINKKIDYDDSFFEYNDNDDDDESYSEDNKYNDNNSGNSSMTLLHGEAIVVDVDVPSSSSSSSYDDDECTEEDNSNTNTDDEDVTPDDGGKKKTGGLSSSSSSSTVLESTTTTSSSINSSTTTTSTTTTTKTKLNFIDSVCILTTFATAGAIPVMPWAISQLGFVVGPIVMMVVALTNLYFFNFILDVADNQYDACGTMKTLGDCGYALAGRKGRYLFNAFQIGNLILYMPVALETVGLSLQYLVNGSCIGWWNIISFASLFVMIQFMKCWTHVAWLAYVTVAISAAQAFILLPYSFVLYQDDIVNSDEYLGPVQPVLNPHPTWNFIALACSTFPFCLAPIFILLEVRHDMADKSQCKKALSVSIGIQILMYLVPALLCVFLWGWNVSNPVTLEIPRGFLGIVMSSVTVLLPVALDFCIAAKITNDWLAQFLPASLTGGSRQDDDDDDGRGICVQAWYKIVYSSPTSVFSLLMVLAVPNFEILIGVLTGFTIIGICTWAITLCWEMGGRKVEANRFIMWLGAVVGFGLTIWVVAAAIETIVSTDYSSNFFCSGN